MRGHIRTRLNNYLQTWTALGDIVTGMTRQGFNLELRKIDAQWRASFYAAGLAHSVVYGTASEAPPWRAVTKAAWIAIRDPRMAAS